MRIWGGRDTVVTCWKLRNACDFMGDVKEEPAFTVCGI